MPHAELGKIFAIPHSLALQGLGEGFQMRDRGCRSWRVLFMADNQRHVCREKVREALRQDECVGRQERTQAFFRVT